ncbi:MAG: hypothetical protein WDN08_05405 [Rhizomicrobium sp.]
MTFEQRKAAERRHTILALLVEAGGSANESELMTGLIACPFGFEFMLTVDVLRADLDWLQQRKLITSELLMGTMVVAWIARLGVLAIQGRVPIEGLLKPIPQE